MSDAEGLDAALALYLVSGALLILASWVSRQLVRRPAALMALLTCALGSLLMVRHAPAGPMWEPPQWSTEHGVKSRVRMALGLREGGFPEGVRGGPARQGRAGRIDSSGGGETAGGAADTPAGDAGTGSGGWGRFMASPEPASLRREPRYVKDCAECPELAIVPGGAAVIGAAADDAAASAAEKPETEVRFWPGFAIGRGEVTVDQYARFLAATGRPAPRCEGDVGTAPAGLGLGIGHVLPITCVSWYDAVAYASWLKRVSGKPYRLPTAAEWEYAALGGEPPPAWQAGAEHAWGIDGMGGGVAEHVADCWRASVAASGDGDTDLACARRMVKDGASEEPRRWQRPAARRAMDTEMRATTVGFRVARDVR